MSVEPSSKMTISFYRREESPSVWDYTFKGNDSNRTDTANLFQPHLPQMGRILDFMGSKKITFSGLQFNESSISKICQAFETYAETKATKETLEISESRPDFDKLISLNSRDFKRVYSRFKKVTNHYEEVRKLTRPALLAWHNSSKSTGIYADCSRYDNTPRPLTDDPLLETKKSSKKEVRFNHSEPVSRD